MSSKALLEDLKILEEQSIAFLLRKPIRPRYAKTGGDVAHALQQVMHQLRPWLVIPLGDQQAIA